LRLSWFQNPPAQPEPRSIGPEDCFFFGAGNRRFEVIVPDDITPKEVAMLHLFLTAAHLTHFTHDMESMRRYGIERLFREVTE
jgi:hypothetical protein